MGENTAGYVSDHWCGKGHVLLCLEGEMKAALKACMSYQVADNAEPHRSRSVGGAKLFIVD